MYLENALAAVFRTEQFGLCARIKPHGSHSGAERSVTG
jgi:hypothetical protein